MQAAPSLPITEPPVSSAYLDGPPVDPGSTNGQWFITLKATRNIVHTNSMTTGSTTVVAEGKPMPPPKADEVKFSKEEIEKVKAWIKAGAKDN